MADVGGLFLLAALAWQGTAAPIAAEQYVFGLDLDRAVGVHRHQWAIFGHLNEDGELIAEGKRALGTRDKAADWFNHIINDLSYEKPVACYELHSGRLIKGIMTPAGSFVPDVGSQVIRFEDYRYTRDGLRIWNLPGYFMLRREAEQRRRWLSEHLAESPEYAKEKARLDQALRNAK